MLGMDCLPHIHVAAIHADPGHGYNTFTPGIGVMCESKFLVGGGIYRNSISRTSTYAAVGYQPMRLANVKIGFIAGAVTGYLEDVVPLAAVLVSYKNVHFTLIPEVKTKTPAVVGISFTWK